MTGAGTCAAQHEGPEEPFFALTASSHQCTSSCGFGCRHATRLCDTPNPKATSELHSHKDMQTASDNMTLVTHTVNTALGK